MIRRLVPIFVVIAVVATACSPSESELETTTTTAAATNAPTTTTATAAPAEPRELDPDGFYLVLMWHQHQPLYPKNEDGVVTRPWVRVHATKDYYDMAALVGEYPDVRATFNLTPVLLRQLEELTQGTKDIYWALTEVPADALSDEDRGFVLQRFFDVNPRVIARFPRFQELAAMRDDPASFTDDDVRDLQVLFNLAWTDPSFLAEEPLASLVAKERGFAEADKTVLLAEHERIIAATFTIHRELWESGQIEVTTTPLAHPILPLLIDTNQASVGDPSAQLPRLRFQEPGDATIHVERGLAEAERLLGQRPRGMWPGEGAVSQLAMGAFASQGVEWVGTGEDVLAKSLDLGSFERNDADTVLDAETLYKPYTAQLSRGREVAMFFRDVVLSDRIGFEYSGSPADAAADDFMQRLADIEQALAGVEGPKVVSVILDGENAWEHYDNDGIDFLRALYERLSNADFVHTVTPSELLDAFPDAPEPIEEVFPSAWFSPNFATWIGEQEEALGWDYLARARADFARAADSGDVPEDQLAQAFDLMLFAEGSDWFWWYGADQDSGDDGYFDGAFRELLGQMYDALGQERPDYTRIPIIPQRPVQPDSSQTEIVTAQTDGNLVNAEWSGASMFSDPGGGLAEIRFAVDRETLYLALVTPTQPIDGAYDVYLQIPSAGVGHGLSEDGEILGFNATHRIRWVGGEALPPELWTEEGAVTIADATATGNDSLFPAAEPVTYGIELAAPLAPLGNIESGDRITFRVVDRTTSQFSPAAGPGIVQLPDISNIEVVFEATDPEGDDHGPGTYTYPTDGVFTAGSYDLTSFSVGVEGDDIVFTFDVLASIGNPWNSPRGFSVQTFDVYVDKDPGASTGARILLPGRNAALPDTYGWEYGLTLEGWDPALYVADATGATEETKPTFKVFVIGDEGRVVARLDRSLFGDGDPAEWGYTVAVLSQEGFPSSGVRRVRDVLPTGEQYRIGGGTGSSADTRIIDLLAPEPGVQEDLLGNFDPDASSGGLDVTQLGVAPVLAA